MASGVKMKTPRPSQWCESRFYSLSILPPYFAFLDSTFACCRVTCYRTTKLL